MLRLLWREMPVCFVWIANHLLLFVLVLFVCPRQVNVMRHQASEKETHTERERERERECVCRQRQSPRMGAVLRSGHERRNNGYSCGESDETKRIPGWYGPRSVSLVVYGCPSRHGRGHYHRRISSYHVSAQLNQFSRFGATSSSWNAKTVAADNSGFRNGAVKLGANKTNTYVSSNTHTYTHPHTPTHTHTHPHTPIRGVTFLKHNDGQRL